MNSPKVSIVIPVYNGSDYIASAIECALRQSYENLEIIVVNDGSTDGGRTEHIALSYGDKIRYFSKQNGGVSSALNFGIQNMTGDYFSWLSHDDAYSPSKISDSVELLRQHGLLGEKVIAFTGGHYIDNHGEDIGNFPIYFDVDRVYSGLECVRIMTNKGTLNGCCMLIPESAFRDAGLFNETLRYSQDSLMWYQCFLAGYALISDNRNNVMYRIHRNQTSQLRRDLYQHDALVISKLLAEPLMKAESSGDLLRRYIKRLTKYECTDAIRYLYDYAKEHGCLNMKDRVEIGLSRLFGSVRYRIVNIIKKSMIHFRR